MSQDETSVVDGQFASLIDRILAVREEIDARQEDVRDIYKELKGLGFDKTAAGTLVNEMRRRAKDGDAVDERDAILDLYREAYQRAKNGPHAHAGARATITDWSAVKATRQVSSRTDSEAA